MVKVNPWMLQRFFLIDKVDGKMKKVGGNPQFLHSAESEENKKTRLSHILIFQYAIWVIAITMLESFFEKHF